MLLGVVSSVTTGLIFFAVAYFGCQMGVVFYNALLGDIVSAKYVGLVSGIGRMFGYSGALVALFIIRPVVLQHGYKATFFPTGAMFLLFALPCMFLVKDPPCVRPCGFPWRSFFTAQALRSTLEKLRQALFPGSRPDNDLSCFLKATFFSLMAVNTVILFMSVYATVVFALSETEIIRLISFSTLFAIFGSIISGALSDYLGQKRFLMLIFLLWIGGLLFGALLADNRFYLFLGGIIGYALGAIWVVLRAFLIRITPAPHLGEAFGLFNLLGYLSGICGALFWSGLLLLLRHLGPDAYRIALASLSVFIVAGLTYVRRIGDREGTD